MNDKTSFLVISLIYFSSTDYKSKTVYFSSCEFKFLYQICVLVSYQYPLGTVLKSMYDCYPDNLIRVVRNQRVAYAKTKTQISFAVTSKSHIYMYIPRIHMGDDLHFC